jgi:hypothetical protein
MSKLQEAFRAQVEELSRQLAAEQEARKASLLGRVFGKKKEEDDQTP